MKDQRNGFSIVLAGLWFINLLILIFGFPFLIFKKLQEVFSNDSGKIQSSKDARPTRRLPCRNQ